MGRKGPSREQEMRETACMHLAYPPRCLTGVPGERLKYGLSRSLFQS